MPTSEGCFDVIQLLAILTDREIEAVHQLLSVVELQISPNAVPQMLHNSVHSSLLSQALG